ncbi:MAG TPA: hypothetical protein VGF01_01765 [Terracidiphilus sp.]|jgi:hypothetical protein
MTLIDLLIMMFATVCGTLLDIAIHIYLGENMHRTNLPFAFLIGLIIGVAMPLFLDAKRVRRFLFVILMSIPICVALYCIFLLRYWKFTVFTADFSIGFYIPLFGFILLCLLSIITTTFPVCKNNKCGKNDFQRCILSPDEQKEERANQWITYECRCGDKYVRRKKKLMTLNSEQKAHPYKKLVGFHKWADDTAQ